MTHQPTLTAVLFPPSPWSERARWALHYSGMPFQAMVYTPMISTARVRWLTRNVTKKVTVPVAVQGDSIMRDSFEIAQYANDHRLPERQDLFPAGKLDDIRYWNHLSENILGRLRLRALPRMKANQQMKLNSLPPFIPSAMKPFFLPLANMAMSRLESKYALVGGDHKEDIVAGLKLLRATLASSQSDYLLGQFSYADITMAVVFQAICPCGNEYVPMDSASRDCWTDRELAAEFEDLILWRDRIYKQHRLIAQSQIAQSLNSARQACEL